MSDFINWVKSEMKQRGLTQKEVAGTTVTRPQVSMVLTGKSEPGEKFYLAVARAFRLPLDEIYSRAGMATSAPKTDTVEKIARKVADLPPESQEQAEQFIDFLRSKKPKSNEPTEQDLTDKATKLTTEQRRKVIETGDTLRQIRKKKKNQPEKPPSNQHPPIVHQSQLL